MTTEEKIALREMLMKKSVNDLLDYAVNTWEKYQNKRDEVEALKKEKASSDVKETSKELRKENAKLRAQLEAIRKTIAPKENA